MSLGYVGKLLWVNLTEGQTEVRPLGEHLSRKFIGGSGLAAKILWDETSANTAPFSPENILILMTGPLTGTSAPMSSRLTVASLSPLTGIWGESHSGGSWADELKRAGFDGIVIKGKAEKPVYLWINDGEVRIINAEHLWGKDAYEVDGFLKKETDERAITLAIGQAGERLVKLACLISDGPSVARAAARCGLGAVMGSKNLKAVVVKGSKRTKVHNPEGLKASVQKNWASKITMYDPKKRGEYYAQKAIGNYESGKDPVQNWKVWEFKGFAEKYALEVQRGKPLFCRGCRTSCFESAIVGDRRRTMAGAIEMLGACCSIDNMEDIGIAYHLCNEFGIDHKGTGAAIAFAMECFENGLINTRDTEGIELTFGNSKAMVEMVRKIGLRSGFGELLGQGVKRAAEVIGGDAYKYAVHCKGLEFPNWDARSSNFRALAQVTANIGADPYATGGPLMKHSSVPELGIYERDAGKLLFSVDDKGEIVAKMQNYGIMANCMGTCLFVFFDWMTENEHLTPSACVEWLNYATGWDMDLNEFIKCGERIFNLQRMINVRLGISRKDDVLPPRFADYKLPDGPQAGHLPPVEKMLPEYYSYRGWDKEGIPTKEKLAELDL